MTQTQQMSMADLLAGDAIALAADSSRAIPASRAARAPGSQLSSTRFSHASALSWAIRVERLVARHVQFGKTPSEARAWVATTDQRNSELVAGAAGRADRVIVNGAADWGLG